MLFMFSGGRSKLNSGNRGSVFPHSDVEPDSDNETDRGRFAVEKTFYLHHRKVKFMDKYIPIIPSIYLYILVRANGGCGPPLQQ